MKIRSKEILKRNNVYTQKGITLIALVITIIILMILAGISISLVLGDNGIITKAKQAKTTTEQAKQNEEIWLNEAVKYIEEMGASGSTTNPTDNPTIEKSEVEKSRDSGTYMTEPTTIKDSNGNTIEVPEGFKIAEDSGKNVTEGIVIEDNDIVDGIGNNRGNQYVWIPVGNGIKKSDGTTVDITLGRYIFADGINHKDSNGNTLLIGTPILKQSADNYEDETLVHFNEIYPTKADTNTYQELKASITGIRGEKEDRLNDMNTTALDLKGFVNSVKANGGYYIARYEASHGVDGKANSKISDKYDSYIDEGKLVVGETQKYAATASRNLYTTATTDLINSYAWDTAIVYIQNFSGATDYSYQTTKNTSLSNTGNNGDEVCKINDMSSNCAEWTTEYSKFVIGKIAMTCVWRGGRCEDIDRNTICRGGGEQGVRYDAVSFRIILYM